MWNIPSLKRHITIFAIAIALTLIITNFTEDISENIIKDVYYRMTGGPPQGWKVIYDEKGVPYIDYGTVRGVHIGKQRNPVFISQTAMRYYDEYMNGSSDKKQLFLNCADWIVNNSVSKGNFSVLEYHFPWPIYNLTPPWRSGMAQGQALQVMIRADSITHNSRYLKTAKSLLNAFFYEVDEGGVTYKTNDSGWWYEEYAKEGAIESRPLNGMIFALFGIYEYYLYTNDSDAKFLFDQGVLAVEKNLPRYDDNGYSYYDVLGHPAGGYHKIHIWQLGKLYNITSIEIFKKYHDRWAAYHPPPEPMFVVRLFQPPLKGMEIAIFTSNLIAVYISLEAIQYVWIMAGRRKKTNEGEIVE